MQLVLFNILFLLLVCRNINAHTWYRTATTGVGAVYTMSNGAILNQILVHRLDVNGQLTMVSAINTNGIGV